MKRKVFIISMILCITIFMIKTNVYASSFELNSDKEKVIAKEGETIEINLSIENIDMNEQGINTVEGFIKYDEDIVDTIELVDKNSWKITYNTEKENNLYGKFLSIKQVDGIKNVEEFVTLKIKLKDNIEKESGKITIKDITSNDGENLINVGEKVINIEIKKEENPPTDEKDDENSKDKDKEKETEKEDKNDTDKEKDNTIDNNEKNSSEENKKTDKSTSNDKEILNENSEEQKKVENNSLKTGDIIPNMFIIIISLIIIMNVLVSIKRKRGK